MNGDIYVSIFRCSIIMHYRNSFSICIFKLGFKRFKYCIKNDYSTLLFNLLFAKKCLVRIRKRHINASEIKSRIVSEANKFHFSLRRQIRTYAKMLQSRFPHTAAVYRVIQMNFPSLNWKASFISKKKNYKEKQRENAMSMIKKNIN